MVLLTTTPEILHAISRLPPRCPDNSPYVISEDSSLPTPSTPSALSTLPTSLDEPISHSALIAVAQQLSLAGDHTRHFSLNRLLHGTQLYIAPPKENPKPSAEYLALKAKLLREQEQREYNRLVHAKSEDGIQSRDEAGEDDISPSLVVNILLSILLSGFAVYWATRFWPNQGIRVLVALGAAVVVGTAESVVYAAYLRKADSAKERESRKREKKTLIPVDGTSIATAKADGGQATELIWGRGPNGGARRRVQERWMKNQADQMGRA